MFEVLATWVAPWLMGRIGPVRAGLWLASWQIACLAAGMAIFLKFTSHPIISASGIVGGTILSRLGLRGFDLCAQIIVQEVSFLHPRYIWTYRPREKEGNNISPSFEFNNNQYLLF